MPFFDERSRRPLVMVDNIRKKTSLVIFGLLFRYEFIKKMQVAARIASLH